MTNSVPFNAAGDDAPTRQWPLLVACGGVFVASAAVTVGSCGGATCCTSIAMPGGWSLSKIWLPSMSWGWAGSFGSFLWMWSVMMVAMMLPSLTPVLLRLRRDGAPCSGVGRVTAAYFLVWMIFGAAAYPIGAALSQAATRFEPLSRAVPMLTGAALLLAGFAQWTPWKTQHLACCRAATRCDAGQAGCWRSGLELGVHCAKCCSAIMVFMLVAGSMEWRVMLVTTLALTVERVLPKPTTIARVTGVMMIVAGAYLLFHPGS